MTKQIDNTHRPSMLGNVDASSDDDGGEKTERNLFGPRKLRNPRVVNSSPELDIASNNDLDPLLDPLLKNIPNVGGGNVDAEAAARTLQDSKWSAVWISLCFAT